MEFDKDFWISILLSTIGAAIFSPMLVKWVEKNGWIKIDRNEKNED